MRTTIDIPDELAREAKLVAVRRGTTLRELFTKALRRELTRGSDVKDQVRILDFPLIRPDHPSVRITESDIRAAESDDDIRRSGLGQ